MIRLGARAMRFRLTTRRMLLAVGIAALLLAVGREGWLAQEYDRSRRTVAYCREKADARRRELAYCLDQSRRGVPYDMLRRQGEIDTLHPGPPPAFPGWAEEAAHHARWATTYDRAADLATRRTRQIKRRTLLR